MEEEYLPCTTIKKTKSAVIIEYPEIDVSESLDIVFRFKNGKVKYKVIQYLDESKDENTRFELNQLSIPEDWKITESKYQTILSSKKFNVELNYQTLELTVLELMSRLRDIIFKIKNLADCNQHKYSISKYRVILFKFLQHFEDVSHLKYKSNAPQDLIDLVSKYRDISTYILNLVGMDCRDNCIYPYDHMDINCGFIHHKYYNKGHKHRYNLNFIEHTIKYRFQLFLKDGKYDEKMFIDNMNLLKTKLINEIPQIQNRIDFTNNNRYICTNNTICQYRKNYNCYFIHDLNDEKSLLEYLHQLIDFLEKHNIFNFERKECLVCEKSVNAICINKHHTKRMYYQCICKNKTIDSSCLQDLLDKLAS